MITGAYDSQKIPMVNYFEEATVSSHFKRPAQMTTTYKVGWSIPGSKNGFACQRTEHCFAKQEEVHKLPRSLLWHKDIISATTQIELAERLSNMGSQQLLGGPVLPRPYDKTL